MISSPRRERATAAPLCASGLAALAFIIAPGITQAAAVPKPVKVMTRNLYLGADLTPAIVATSIPALAVAGTQIWNTVQATDFPARAKVLAKEISDADPALIGLQEASLWRTGPPDGPPILGGTAATTVQYDYLQLLLGELAAIGSPYVVVYSQQEADLESITASGFDIRLTQRDVILANKSKVDTGEITCTNAQGANYPSAIQLTLQLLPPSGPFVESTRGYVSADCVANQRAFRFVNTHLEAFSAGRRAQQAGYLAQYGPASTTSQKVILVGDLNSDPNDASVDLPDPTPNNTAFNLLKFTFGYVDTWTVVNGAASGFTSGFNEFVDDPDTSGLTKRIDHVMTRPLLTVRTSRITGTDPDNRTPDGLWPSDHAGVVTTLAP
ncbi:MAG: endonuclease/exonuclease/phosphatase family protein [Candidatus Binatia bacterium]